MGSILPMQLLYVSFALAASLGWLHLVAAKKDVENWIEEKSYEYAGVADEQGDSAPHHDAMIPDDYQSLPGPRIKQGHARVTLSRHLATFREGSQLK
ncbi:hypothetical protein F5Y05DRAFT_276342 [Hypoxylon sp. FL0543]|nr:hypothetical protein F5Y05DRAFT_276342 [Hypoxylon sp. FL0543]